MALNTRSLVAKLHQTMAKTFQPTVQKSIQIYTPGWVSAINTLDPVYTSAATAVSATGLLVTISTEERSQPQNEGVEFKLFVNKANNPVDSTTHIEISGVRWDVNRVVDIADAEWIIYLERL